MRVCGPCGALHRSDASPPAATRAPQVGFFPDDAPENFEGRRYLKHLSAITGGTYQEYRSGMHRIYREDVGFVPYDLRCAKGAIVKAPPTWSPSGAPTPPDGAALSAQVGGR